MDARAENPEGAGAPTEDLLRSAQSRSSTCSHGHTSHGTVKRPWGGEQRPLHLRDLRDLRDKIRTIAKAISATTDEEDEPLSKRKKK